MSDEGGGASRSTDPAAGSSAATDVSLREHLTLMIRAVEQRHDQRFESIRESVEKAFENSQRAIDKADLATEKRFEGVNEFRAALSDQAQHFVTRDALAAVVEKIEAQTNRMQDDADALARRIDLREGQTEGSRLTTGYLVTITTVAVGVIGLIIVLANYFSG